MIFLLALLTLSLLAAVMSVRSVFHDDRGSVPPPASHREDPAFQSPHAA